MFVMKQIIIQSREHFFILMSVNIVCLGGEQTRWHCRCPFSTIKGRSKMQFYFAHGMTTCVVAGEKFRAHRY